MPLFAANISLLYPELDFLDRYAAARRDGFEAIEALFPYEHPREVLAQRLADAGLRQVLINAPPGDFAAGERGTSCLPGREAEFRADFERGLGYAQACGSPRIHVLAGCVAPEVPRDRPSAERSTYLKNLEWAAAMARPAGIDVLIEPINTRDIPGYFLNRQHEAHAIVNEIGAPNLKVQFDLYHCQIVEGDVAMKIREYLPTGRIGHFQVAGVPARNEPDIGELNCAYLFDVIDEVSAQCGWAGYIGCEYRPADPTSGGTTRGLAWRDRLVRR